MSDEKATPNASVSDDFRRGAQYAVDHPDHVGRYLALLKEIQPPSAEAQAERLRQVTPTPSADCTCRGYADEVACALHGLRKPASAPDAREHWSAPSSCAAEAVNEYNRAFYERVRRETIAECVKWVSDNCGTANGCRMDREVKGGG